MIQRVLTLGPIHEWLPGAMKLSLSLYGDRILSAETEFGFASREIEKKVKGKHYLDAQRFLSRSEPESAFILDQIFCECIESAAKIEVGARTLWAREITSGLSELILLLKYLAKMAERLGLKVLSHIILKHREELLDLIELLTGSRYGYYFLTPGNTRYEVTAGFIERLEAWIKNYQQDFSRIEAMFFWTQSLQNSLRSIGRVVDDENYAFVSAASSESSRMGEISNVESRLRFALHKSRDISGEVQETLIERHPLAPKIEILNPFHEKRAEAKFESHRGNLEMKISFGKDQTISNLELSLPSDLISKAIPHALEDETFEDLPIILQSLNFLVTEIDR